MDTMYFPSAEAAIDSLCRYAAETNSSDIHIEPEESSVRIRFRRDGLLYEYGRLQAHMTAPLAVRCKVMGRMNVAETRIPQDGGSSFSYQNIHYNLRISTLPSLYGETIVIRLLSSQVPFIENNALGMFPVQETAFRQALFKQSGLILTTGPTGSGKTSTLYAALRLLNKETVNIISIEDPVEYKIPGITQININEKAGLTFASGLRSLVRQDPDILMIGEIRDRETADIAIHAALTGHLVLSTLHTNNAASVPLRLMDMGIPAYLIAASLSLILSQRLVRTRCQCHEQEQPSCPFCKGSGFYGRTGIFELITVTAEVKDAIRKICAPIILQNAMKEQKQLSLAEAAILHSKQGTISSEDAVWVAASAES